MTESDKPNSASEAGSRMIGILLALIFVSGGGTAVWKYQRRNISHRKCNSMIWREEGRKLELVCIDSSSTDFGKIFNASFSRDLTYYHEEPDFKIHYWLCRRINDTATFSCDAKRVEPPPTEERQLTHDEVESLRRRNECELRFYDNKIYEIGGMSVMAACKQNPERTR